MAGVVVLFELLGWSVVAGSMSSIVGESLWLMVLPR